MLGEYELLKCILLCACVSDCVYVYVYVLLISSGLLPEIAHFLGWEPPCRVEPYVSAALTLFQARLFSHISILSLPSSTVDPPTPPHYHTHGPFLPLPSHLFMLCDSFFCFYPLAISLICPLFIPISPFPPLSAFCCTSLATPPRPPHNHIQTHLSFLFSLSPRGLVQLLDQTEQHDSQRRAQFPLVHQSISNRSVCRTLNHRWKHETLTD